MPTYYDAFVRIKLMMTKMMRNWEKFCRKFDCWSLKSFYQQIWRNRQLFISNVTRTGSICLFEFFIYCVCLFPFAKFFFFSFMLCYHICWCNKVVYVSQKSPILTHPTCIRRPRRGWPRSNFAEIFGNRKLESLGYRVVLFCVILCLAVLVELRLVTDRHRRTETQTQAHS